MNRDLFMYMKHFEEWTDTIKACPGELCMLTSLCCCCCLRITCVVVVILYVVLLVPIVILS